MHGLGPNGKKGRNNKAHVFAFDPYGQQLKLKELSTDKYRSIFDTSPDNLYMVNIESDRCREAKNNLKNQTKRPKIDRIRKNTKKRSKSKMSVKIIEHGEEIKLEYNGEQTTLTEGEVTLDGQGFKVIKLWDDEVLDPGKLAEKILSVKDPGQKKFIIHNYWENLFKNYLYSVVEPLLRARTLEWCSPTIVSSPNHSQAYQLANKVKDTHRVRKNEKDIFQLNPENAFGITSTLKPMKKNISSLEERISKIKKIYREGKKKEKNLVT